MPYQPTPEGVFYDADTGRLYYHKHYARAIFWSPQMLHTMRTMFPTTRNEEMAGILGMSLRTIVRKARAMGLKKDPAWMRDVYNSNRRLAQAAAKVHGNSGRFVKGQHANLHGEYKPGRTPTASELAKHAEAMRIKWRSPAYRKKVEEALRPFREQQSAYMLAKWQDPEYRARISAAQKAAWARKKQKQNEDRTR